jgi:hypothetical protein
VQPACQWKWLQVTGNADAPDVIRVVATLLLATPERGQGDELAKSEARVTFQVRPNKGLQPGRVGLPA